MAPPVTEPRELCRQPPVNDEGDDKRRKRSRPPFTSWQFVEGNDALHQGEGDDEDDEHKWGLAFWARWPAPPRWGSNWGKTRGIREWVSWVPLAVTTDATPLGKYESLETTTSVLGQHPQGSQSLQTSRVIATRQCRSSQRRQRNGLESLEEQNSRHAWHTS